MAVMVEVMVEVMVDGDGQYRVGEAEEERDLQP